MGAERVYPFANGSQFGDWVEKNCDNCTRSPKAKGDPTCDLEVAIWNAYYGTGSITEEIARRMNYLTPDGRTRALCYSWPCNEILPISEEVRGAVGKWRARDAIGEDAGAPDTKECGDGR
jgi:hypothetical protein